jgi:hypothetical protein
MALVTRFVLATVFAAALVSPALSQSEVPWDYDKLKIIPGDDIRRVLGEEISVTKIRCTVRNNSAGYNADGYVNFRSFLKAPAKLDKASGVLVFKANTPDTQDIRMTVNLSEDQMHIAEFRVVVDELTKTRKRTGTLVEPAYEDVTDRKRTFDMVCVSQPR